MGRIFGDGSKPYMEIANNLKYGFIHYPQIYYEIDAPVRAECSVRVAGSPVSVCAQCSVLGARFPANAQWGSSASVCAQCSVCGRSVDEMFDDMCHYSD